jgi:hypothetical protein
MQRFGTHYGNWKMARAVSYEHRDAPYENTRKEVTIQPEVLDRYAGQYEAPKTGALTVTRANNLLILIVGGDKRFVLHPRSEDIFFTADRDLTFEFVKTGATIFKIVVREHGAVVEEASRSK